MVITDKTSASLVNNFTRDSMDGLQGAYYRSKLFVVPFTTNPMVAAAAPLLSLIERLSRQSVLTDLQVLRRNIEHELRAFYCQLQGKAYTSEFNAMAYYFVCATIDELIKVVMQSSNRETIESYQPLLVSAEDGDASGSRVFDLIDCLKDKPTQYLDLLELAYYCLAAGFQGQYRYDKEGVAKLDTLSYALSELILNYRVNPTYTLFSNTIRRIRPKSSKKKPIVFGLFCLSMILVTGAMGYRLIQDKISDLESTHIILKSLGNRS